MVRLYNPVLPITSEKIQDGTIVTADLADGCISSPKIIDRNVGQGKLSLSAVDVYIIDDDAVETAKIKDGNVTKAKMALLDYELWLSPLQFMQLDETGWRVDVSSRFAAPLIVDSWHTAGCGLFMIPVDGKLKQLTFHGSLGNAASQLRFYVYRNDDIESGDGSTATLHDSGIITGSAGHKTDVYNPDPDLTILTDKCYALIAQMEADTTEFNAKFYGVKIEYQI